MIKSKAIKIGLSIATFLCVFCVCLGFGSLTGAQAQTFTSDYFIYTNATSEEAFADINGNKGLLLKGFNNGSLAKTSDILSGETDIRFSFWGNGVKKVSFVVTDKDNDSNSFKVTVRRESGELNVSVAAFGNERGIYYLNGKANGNTDVKNDNGEFTRITESERYNTFRFNPDTMSVSVGDEETELLVWNLFLSQNDYSSLGGTMDAVSRYTLTISFDVTENEQSGLLIYRFNDQRFDSILLKGGGVNSAGPRIFADVAFEGTKGENYSIPRPYAYDVIDGTLDDVFIEILNEKGQTLLSKVAYTEELSFVPTTCETYTLRYSVTDSDGIATTTEYSLPVTEIQENADITYSSAGFNETLGVGSTMLIPQGVYKSNKALDGERTFATSLTIKLNGTVVNGYDNVYVNGSEEFFFENTGKYEFIYISNGNSAFTDILVFEITESDASISDTYIAAYYDVNDSVRFVLPEITVGNATETASILVEFPSGKAYKGQNYLLSETGVYTVTYSATINGNEYSFSQNFTVRQSAYTVDMNSKAAYGTNNYISGEKGLNVTLSPKGEFIYNQILDLSENTKEDRLLRLFLTPSVTGEREADGVEIVITDLYNPENYITVRTTYNSGLDIQSYVKAAAAGRTLSGYSMIPENGAYFVGGDYGRHVWLSVNGTVRDGQKQLDAFEIYYDYSEKQIHVGANACHGNWDQRMVCDLDDPACFADTWEGFTTGEVIISLRAYNCVSENFNFFLTEVNGKKVETDYVVFNAPKISVNTLGMDETDLPLAVVGKSYPVYAAEAYDATIGKLDVSVKAIYAYGSANEIILDVVNGEFIPAIPGKYALVYTAKNLYGKQAEKVLYIDAIYEQDFPALEMNVENLPENGKLGLEITLPQANITGGSGAYTVEYYYKHESENGWMQSDGNFLPEKLGKYLIKYIVSDYIGNQSEKTYEFTAMSNDMPIWQSEAELPSAFIAGKGYELPNIQVKDYSDGMVKDITATIFVNDGRTETEITNNTFIPEIRETSYSVDIIYKVGEFEKTYNIPVNVLKRNEEFDMTQVFAGKDVSVIATEPDEQGNGRHSVEISSLAENASAEYLLPLVAGVFSLNFEMGETSKAEVIHFYVSDYYNDSILVKLSLYKNAGSKTSSYLSINDGLPYTMNGSFGAENKTFILSYNEAFGYFSDGASMKAIVKNTVNGAAFNGFPSGYIRLKIEIPDESGTVLIRYINNQRMSASKNDWVEPDIYVKEGAHKTFEQGTEYVLPTAYVSDVLDWEISYFLISVQAPNGSYVTDINGKILKNVPVENYKIVLSLSGSYNITFKAADSTGNMASVIYTIRVTDTTPPTITIVASDIGEVNVGAVVTIPQAVATDAENDAIYVYVVKPDGASIAVKDGAFTQTDLKGTYVIRYIAFDSYGNMAVEEISFRVV